MMIFGRWSVPGFVVVMTIILIMMTRRFLFWVRPRHTCFTTGQEPETALTQVKKNMDVEPISSPMQEELYLHPRWQKEF